MKKRSRIVAVVTTLVMTALLLMTGCGNKLTAEDIAGSYRCTMECGEYINEGITESMEEELGTDKDFDFEFQTEMPADFVLTVNEDETYVLEIDMATFKESFGAAMDAEGMDFIKAILAAMEIDSSQVSEDQMNQVLDQMKAQIEENFESDELKDEASISGEFTLDDNEITIVDGSDKYPGTIEGDAISFKGSLLDSIKGQKWVFTKE